MPFRRLCVGGGSCLPLIFKDALFNAQWLRTVGHSYSGGAEIGEYLTAARQIREPDADSCFDTWSELADQSICPGATQFYLEETTTPSHQGLGHASRHGYMVSTSRLIMRD